MPFSPLAATVWLAIAPAQSPAPPASARPDRVPAALERLYNFDFRGAHDLLDRQIAEEPSDPLGYAMRAAAYLFSELDRTGILEAQFFANDGRIIDRKRKVEPDPATRTALFRAVDDARFRAVQRLAREPEDRRALFSLCAVSGIETDYIALIEKRQWRSMSYAKKAQAYAVRLLKVDPTFYDAYLTAGVSEYLVGSLPFFLRWFVSFEGVEGSKRRAVDNLELAARSGRYLGPFAKILLAIVYMREKQPEASERMLREFERQYPANPLVRRELVRLEAGGR